MKKTMLILALTFGFAQAQAQSSETRVSIGDMKLGASKVEGLNIELTRPILDAEIKTGQLNVDREMENVYGITAGYKKLIVREMGIIADLSLLSGEVKGINDDWNIARGSASAAYAFNSLLHAKAGLNMSYLLSAPGNIDDEVDEVGLGYQIGAGIQINKRMAADIKYISMKQEGNFGSRGVDVEQTGIELGLGATF